MKPSILILATSALLACASRGEAQLIGVQLQENGSALSPSQTAGVIPQDNFNFFTGTQVTSRPLATSTGATSTETFGFSAPNTFYTGAGTATNDDTLVSGKAGPNYGGSSTYTFGNLAAGEYTLLVYTVNDNAGQVSNFAVGGTSFSITDQAGSAFAADNTFIKGTNTTNTAAAASTDVANYLEFDDITVPAGGSITLTDTQISGAFSGAGGGAINGFQLQAEDIPEPTTAALMLGGMALVAGASKLKKRA